jgi:hypothetical protein
MNDSQKPGEAPLGRPAGTESPGLASEPNPQEPWRWKPEYWERYWREAPASPMDLATAR